MSHTTKKRLVKIANFLERCAYGIAFGLGLVILDAATPKRIRRSRR